MLKNGKKKISKKGTITIAIVIITLITIATILFNQTKIKIRKKKIVADSELARAMTYDEFGDGEENIDGTENVKFGAFFLRDINNDGYAEKIKGTCKQIGKEDTYIVRWQGSTGREGNATSMELKETADGASQVSDEFEKSDSSMISMENITSNTGIYFSNPVALLGENGWIRVYDDETEEVVHEFNKDDWQKYSSDNPYRYDKPVKHIKVVTSATNAYSTIFVYNIKKLDDEYITSNYTREEFDDLKRIYSTLTGYLDDKYITTDRKSANYEAPYSIAQITLSKDKISTQETEKDMQIKIQTLGDERLNQQKWTNGAFVLKLPKDIINLDINSVEVDNANINIDSYEVYESNGERFIKIITSNKSPAEYTLKEVLAPEGYSKIKDITFKVDGTTGELKLINTNVNNEAYTVDENTVKLVMEDSPSFKLIKKDSETQETSHCKNVKA